MILASQNPASFVKFYEDKGIKFSIGSGACIARIAKLELSFAIGEASENEELWGQVDRYTKKAYKLDRSRSSQILQEHFNKIQHSRN